MLRRIAGAARGDQESTTSMPRPSDPWRELPSGYCYHSAVLTYKTETLLAKWREGKGDAKRRALLAYELSFRDPALALREVRAALADPRSARRRKTLRLCLHHVADADTARELFASDDFDPDALHLSAFAALLDDFLAALPSLDAAAAEAALRKLGFLDGPPPSPLVDAPRRSDAQMTSVDRYAQLLLRFLGAVLASHVGPRFRKELAEHLRRTYRPDAYQLLLEHAARGELEAIDAIAAVPRLGWARAEAVVGREALERLVESFVVALARPPCAPFDELALENGWLPSSVQDFPPPQARAIALAFLDSEWLTSRAESAAEALVASGPDGGREVIDRASRLPPIVVASAARSLPYAEARERLLGAGATETHLAIVTHPDVPADRTLLARAEELAAARGDEAAEILAGVAAAQHHPDRDRAFARLLELGSGARGDAARPGALFQLGQLGDARATPVLIEALDDPSLAGSSALVCAALLRAGDGRAIDALRRHGHVLGVLEAIAAVEARRAPLR
jgi:hypothetical protein